jgi:phage tail sheath gpL-like
MAEIPITGVPSTFRVPGQYAEILFAQGPATAAAEARSVLLCMPKLSGSGTYVAGQVYQIKNESNAIAGAGSGSPLHRAARIFLKSNKTAKLFALPYAPTSGGVPATADLDVTWTTDPTGTGVTTVNIAGEGVSVSFTDADTVTTIAAAMVLAANARTHLPVTATSSAGVMTLQARIAGASQNSHIRVRASIDAGVGTTIATENASDVDALGDGTATAGVDGTTTEAANLAAALTSIDASRYYYMAFSINDATNLSAVQNHVAIKSEPRSGLRSVAIAGAVGPLAATQALATARNFERLQLVWQPNSQHTLEELAANMTAIRQKREEVDTAFNFDFYSNRADWLIKGCYRDADRPDTDDQNDAIIDGVTPIATGDSGSYVVMGVNTRSKDASGNNDDFRATETHRVSVADEVVDTWLLRHSLSYQGKKLSGDKLNADGTVDPNQRYYRNVITPSVYRPFAIGILREFEGEKLQEVDSSVEGLRVVRDPNNGGRLEAGVDLNVVDLFHQMTVRVAEVSTG